MFKNNFINLCNKIGKSPSYVCSQVGISSAAFSQWSDTSVPRRATLMRIADYFGVTVADLLADTPTIIQKPAKDEANDAYKKLEEQIAELRAAMVNERKAAAEPTLSPARREAIDIINELDESDLDDVVKYVKFLQSQNK